MSADVAYCAGFFDGEGHIRISKHSVRGSYMLQVSAVQATLAPLPKFVELFGGTVGKRFTKYRDGQKCMYTWQASSKCAEEALRMMVPYLICKADEAEVALKFRATFRPQYGDRKKNSQAVEDSRIEAKELLERLRKQKRAEAAA